MNTTFRYILIGTGIFIIAYSLATILATIFQCHPFSKLWENVGGRDNCIDFATLLITAGIINAVTDVWILGLPMPLLWRLQLPVSRKWMLIASFSLGGS